MDLIFCINKNSFPAPDKDTGKNLLNDALQGLLQMSDNGNNRYFIYYDSNNDSLLDLVVAENFTYEDFLETSDVDLQSFLWEIEDKSPALDELSEEQINEMAAYNFYVHNEAMDSYSDVYGLAWVVNGYLLSLATDDRWLSSAIRWLIIDGWKTHHTTANP